jgi:hypothetical protein
VGCLSSPVSLNRSIFVSLRGQLVPWACGKRENRGLSTENAATQTLLPLKEGMGAQEEHTRAIEDVGSGLSTSTARDSWPTSFNHDEPLENASIAEGTGSFSKNLCEPQSTLL